MNKEEIKTTNLWDLYSKGTIFALTRTIQADTDLNYRMVYGDPWEGLDSGGIEKISFPMIRRIVSYKVSNLTSNLWNINYSADVYDNPEFQETAQKICDLLNKKAMQVFENNDMDKKIRVVATDACINSEGLFYAEYIKEEEMIEVHVLDKTDVYYGNESSNDIESQPYIIVKQRLPLSNIQDLAQRRGLSAELISMITTDNDVLNQAGEDAKIEIDDMVTLLTKLYKENGTVHLEQATMNVEIIKDLDNGLTMYPLSHTIWYETKGNARGEGVVKNLIPNQLEVNKTAMRRAITSKNISYPQRVVLEDRVSNIDEINKVGGTIRARGADIDDVRKVFTTTTPQQIGTDAEKLQAELINTTNDLESASAAATGNIDPEKASGKAILAVQEASRQPLTDQLQGLKSCLERLARIFVDIWRTYSIDGLKISYETTDEYGTPSYETENIPNYLLKEIKSTCRIDIIPNTPYDKYAKTMSLDNFLQAKLIDLEEYTEALDTNKSLQECLKDIIKKRKQKLAQINQYEMQAKQMQQQMDQQMLQQEEIGTIGNAGQNMMNQAMTAV